MREGSLHLGAIARYNGSEHEVLGISTAHCTIRSIETGEITAVLTGDLLQEATHFRHAVDNDDRWMDDSTTSLGLVTDICGERERRRAEQLAAHIVELETGESPNHPNQRPKYNPDRPIGAREQAKVDELAGTDLQMSIQTLRRKRKNYREKGLSGLIDLRTSRKRNQFASIDPIVKDLVFEQVKAEINEPQATFARFQFRLDQRIAEHKELTQTEDTEPAVNYSYGSTSTLRRLVANTPGGHRLMGSASTKRSNARELEPTSPLNARYPGDVVYLDTTTADVLAIDIDGSTRRPFLTIAVDLRTKLIPAFRFTMTDPNTVDAGEMLFDMVSHPTMADKWEDKLAAGMASVPFERQADYEQRRQALLTRPMIFPDTVSIDGGKMYTSRSFTDACASLGISIDHARHYRGQDKSPVERTFHSLNTMFFQYVRGYVGRSVEFRGLRPDRDAIFSVDHLEDLFEEFLLLEWQHRQHAGLHVPQLPNVAVTPRQVYDLDIAVHGQLPYVATADEAAQLLPVEWRTVSHDGVSIAGRTYSSRELSPWTLRDSPFPGKGKKWPFRVHRGDLRQIYFQHPSTGRWLTVPWRHQATIQGPFGERTWKAASDLIKQRHGNAPIDAELEQQRALAVEELRGRAADGISTSTNDNRLARIFGNDTATKRTIKPPTPNKAPKPDRKPTAGSFDQHIPKTTDFQETDSND